MSFLSLQEPYLGITASTYGGNTSARGALYVQPNASGNVYSHIKVNYIQANKNGGGSYNSGVLEFVK